MAVKDIHLFKVTGASFIIWGFLNWQYVLFVRFSFQIFLQASGVFRQICLVYSWLQELDILIYFCFIVHVSPSGSYSWYITSRYIPSITYLSTYVCISFHPLYFKFSPSYGCHGHPHSCVAWSKKSPFLASVVHCFWSYSMGALSGTVWFTKSLLFSITFSLIGKLTTIHNSTFHSIPWFNMRDCLTGSEIELTGRLGFLSCSRSLK